MRISTTQTSSFAPREIFFFLCHAIRLDFYKRFEFPKRQQHRPACNKIERVDEIHKIFIT